MSENTTPQMGSPEKEPLLKSEGTDQTSAEELLDQISAKTDDFPTVESILQEFGINTAEASGTQNEDAGTENMPERTPDTEEQEHAEPQETETPPGIEPDKAEAVTETDKDSVSLDQAEQESEQSEEKEKTQASSPESKAEHETVPSEKASEEKPSETKDEEVQPEAAAGKQTAEKEPPQEEKSPRNSEDDPGSQAEDEGSEQEGTEDAENASAEPESPPGAEAPDEEESGVDKAVDKLKHLWKIEKKPRKNKEKKRFKDDPEEETASEAENMQPLSAALAMLHQSESETEGMSFMERAQYRAKMRRREQTRLRRENAKRGASSGGEGRYQAMSMMDMQFTLIRLIASAALVIAGALLGSDDHIAFILYLLAYLLAAVPIAGNAIQELSHGRIPAHACGIARRVSAASPSGGRDCAGSSRCRKDCK